MNSKGGGTLTRTAPREQIQSFFPDCRHRFPFRFSFPCRKGLRQSPTPTLRRRSRLRLQPDGGSKSWERKSSLTSISILQIRRASISNSRRRDTRDPVEAMKMVKKMLKGTGEVKPVQIAGLPGASFEAKNSSIFLMLTGKKHSWIFAYPKGDSGSLKALDSFREL